MCNYEFHVSYDSEPNLPIKSRHKILWWNNYNALDVVPVPLGCPWGTSPRGVPYSPELRRIHDLTTNQLRFTQGPATSGGG